MADKRIRLLTRAGDNSADDRISNLPQPIIHQILSQLSGKDVIRTCLLSKSLLSALTSFPFLDLDCSWFKQDKTLDRFLDYVNHSIQRFDITHATLEKFRIRAYLTNSEQARRVVEAIDFAVINCVKLLDIDFESCRYSLPRSVTLASSITTLNLAGLILMNFNEDTMVFWSVLENLSISSCRGLKAFNFSSTKIRSVSLRSCYGLKSIKIQSPSLHSLIFIGEFEQCDVDVSECQFLKLLWLADANINNGVDENIPKLLHLEELKLIRIGSCNPVMTVSSENLKKLQYVKRTWYKGILKIRALNLESLILDDHSELSIILMVPRNLQHLSLRKTRSRDDYAEKQVHCFFGLGSLELKYNSFFNLKWMEMNKLKGFDLMEPTDRTVQIIVRIPNYDTHLLDLTLSLETDGPVPYHSLVTLWNWIASFNRVEVLTLACQSFEVLLCLEQLKAVSLSPMYDLKHLTVGYNTWTIVSPEMIGYLLWILPNLETIWFVSTGVGVEVEDKSIQFHYGSWIRTKDDRNCCRGLSMRCWRHSLKKVELKNFDRDDEEKLRDYFMKNTTYVNIIKH